MKALTLKQIKAPLELKERADLTPDHGEVVVRLKAAALNRRDYWITQGLYPGVAPPVVLGSDGAGVVGETGSSLGNYWNNREVIINPGFEWGDDPRVQSESFRFTQRSRSIRITPTLCRLGCCPSASIPRSVNARTVSCKSARVLAM